VAAPGRGRPPATSIFVGRAVRARVSDRVQHVSDCDSRCLRRDPGRRILAGDFEGALAGVRVGAILHPAVLVALANGAGFLQYGSPIRAASGAPAAAPWSLASNSSPSQRETNPEAAS
jgi:hypothetical protein